MTRARRRHLLVSCLGFLYVFALLGVVGWFVWTPSARGKLTGEEASFASQNEIVGEMVLIPAGEFWMGTDADTASEDDAGETPKHRVYVDAFLIGKYEVTNAQYKRFIDAGGYENPAFWSKEGWDYIQSRGIKEPSLWRDMDLGIAQPDKPVVGVTWWEAEAFAKWVGMRLPTEAEWEKAARGTDGRIWPWGDDWSPEREYAGETPPNDGASPYGVYGMAGGPWEWVNDWYDPDYYKQASADTVWRNPRGPESGTYWTIRGGVFNYTDQYQTRTTDRGTYIGASSCFVGFRLADDVVDPATLSSNGRSDTPNG